MSTKSKFNEDDIIYYFDIDPDLEPTAWIKECRVLGEDVFKGYRVTQTIYDIPYPEHASEHLMFKTEEDAHKHFYEWAKQIADREEKWLAAHKADRL
jgi:hypothetical protein